MRHIDVTGDRADFLSHSDHPSDYHSVLDDEYPLFSKKIEKSFSGDRSSSSTHEFNSTDFHRPKAVLSTATLVSVLYTACVSGGYASEDSVRAAGPLITILMLLLIPILWGIPVAVVVAELSCAIPSNSGSIMWVNLTAPNWIALACVVWSICMSLMDCSLYPTIFSDYYHSLFPSSTPLALLFLKVFFLWICAFIAMAGSKILGYFSLVVLIFTLLPFCLMFLFQLPDGIAWERVAVVPETVDWSVFLPIILWNFSGFEAAGNLVEEVQNPEKVFLPSLLWTIGLAIVTYILPILVGCSALLLRDVPLSEWTDGFWTKVGNSVGGHFLELFVGLGAGVSLFGLSFTQIAITSRLVAGIGDLNILPNSVSTWISNYDRKWQTPINATIVVGMVVTICCTILMFEELVKFDQVLYALRITSILGAFTVLRIQKPDLPRPYRVPGGRWGAFFAVGLPLSYELWLLAAVSLKTTVMTLTIFLIILIPLVISWCICYFSRFDSDEEVIEQVVDVTAENIGTFLGQTSAEWKVFHPDDHFFSRSSISRRESVRIRSSERDISNSFESNLASIEMHHF